MSEAAPVSAPTAGALLRAAREQRGIAVPVLAASLKLPVHKIEALEADRYADLTDATFVRALALSVCRHLRVDSEPVLALLPAGDAPALRGSPPIGRMRRGDGPRVAFHPVPWARRPVTWVIATGVAAAVAFLWWTQQAATPPGPGVSKSAAPDAASAPTPTPTPTAPAAAVPAADSAAPAVQMVVTPVPAATAVGPATSAAQQDTMRPGPAR